MADIVGASAAMREVRERIARLAPTSITVLITGETGTGKELVAAALHRLSPRAANPFLCVNCAALPDALFESELFGYERGAFTGAYHARAGLFSECRGGTIFLDEVGDLSLQAQAKLLRVIETKEVHRLGDAHTRPSDFRVVAATNRELVPMVEEGRFRRDLLYRLDVGHIHVPPLREHLEDLPPLVERHLGALNVELGVRLEGVEPDAMSRLLRHTWPGNVRELRNILETACLTCPGPRIRVEDLPSHLRPTGGEAVEKERLLSTLASVDWNKSEAARRLDWSRMTLYRKLAKYGCERPR